MLPEFQRALLLHVGKSQEFLLKVRLLFIFFSTTTQGIRLRRQIDVFFDDVVHYVGLLTRLDGPVFSVPCSEVGALCACVCVFMLAQSTVERSDR